MCPLVACNLADDCSSIECGLAHRLESADLVVDPAALGRWREQQVAS
jgi:hypothetical protein